MVFHNTKCIAKDSDTNPTSVPHDKYGMAYNKKSTIYLYDHGFV